jgi:hypothetical protein
MNLKLSDDMLFPPVYAQPAPHSLDARQITLSSARIPSTSTYLDHLQRMLPYRFRTATSPVNLLAKADSVLGMSAETTLYRSSNCDKH